MREIKFRWWNEFDCKMFEFDFDDVYGGRIEFGGLNFNICRSKVMQFTGLQDKSGVDIYEGDIVDGVIHSDHSVHVGTVLYDYNGYRISTKTKSLPLCLTDKLTIIGNIHQNPELMPTDNPD